MARIKKDQYKRLFSETSKLAFARLKEDYREEIMNTAVKVKFFKITAPNAGGAMVHIKGRDLIREMIPDADIINLSTPITEEKIRLLGTPDIIVVGGIISDSFLLNFPANIDIPVYALGITIPDYSSTISDDLAYRFEQFIGGLKNLRLFSARDNATRNRLEKLGVKARVIGDPVMHLSREAQWARKPISERDRDTLIINYRDMFIPESLLLDEPKALDMARRMGLGKALIVAQEYERPLLQDWRVDMGKPITRSQLFTLGMFERARTFAKTLTTRSPLNKWVHPLIASTLRYSPKEVMVKRYGMKFYDPYAYPLLFQNAPLVITYQLHSSIIAGAVGTPFLHVFTEESTRTRDMIDTYDPGLELHLPAKSSNPDSIISKARSILENPDPLANYNKRVNRAFKEWGVFKKEMRDDLVKLGLLEK